MIDLEDQKLRMLFTCSDTQVTSTNAQEYFKFGVPLSSENGGKKLQEQEELDQVEVYLRTKVASIPMSLVYLNGVKHEDSSHHNANTHDPVILSSLLTYSSTSMTTCVATPSMVKTSNAFTIKSNLGNAMVMIMT